MIAWIYLRSKSGRLRAVKMTASAKEWSDLYFNSLYDSVERAYVMSRRLREKRRSPPLFFSQTISSAFSFPFSRLFESTPNCRNFPPHPRASLRHYNATLHPPRRSAHRTLCLRRTQARQRLWFRWFRTLWLGCISRKLLYYTRSTGVLQRYRHRRCSWRADLYPNRL